VKKTDTYFSTVDLKIDFPNLESSLLKKWKEEGLVDKYLSKNNSSDKYFSFLDGPITANNPMGVHHAWGRTYKDLWQRYKNMKGFKQRFQNGFDCQGLWVEVEVEKDLGIKSKKDIENIVEGDKKASIAKFVDLCKQRVKKYSDVQTEQSKMLGYFVDWDNSYFTLSENNNYMIWHFLKVCHENGWIYKGNDVVPWCPRCETAISQHEILTEDYKEVTHKSVYIKLPIKNRVNEHLLVWTTTPWTIPANTAVAVDSKYTYALVEDKNGASYWILKELVPSVFNKEAKIIKTVKGKELVGLSYESPFDNLPYVTKLTDEEKKKFHIVIATDPLLMPITIEEGTGLVHTSTSTGEEDHRLGKKLGLPVVPAIDDTANYLEGFGDLTGKNAKDEPNIILEVLGDKWTYKLLNYKHRYPACWRCKSELVWKVTDEWYIAMDKKAKTGEANKTLREMMIDVAEKINWIPSFGKERELDWLKNMHDWLISKKNRYWGLALPIWECEKCGSFEVIGSYEELESKVVSGWDVFNGKTPHKPQIDELKIKCRTCGELCSRVEPVGNPWLDAGIVAYSTISKSNKACLFENSSEKPLYKEDRPEWEKWFPADFITESFPGQFKNWFYSLIAMSTVLENKEPTKTILGFATLLAEDGKPMHKSWGNSIEFNEGAKKIGVDVMRWMYVKQNPTDNLLFGYKVADEVRRKFHLKLWNTYNYFVTFANIDGWKPKDTNYGSENVLDKWILANLSRCLSLVDGFLNDYNACRASAEIETFVDDLSNWYIRRSRERVGPSAQDKRDKEMFYLTCYKVLTDLSRILAPFMPFISEAIYTNLTKEESVHLSSWPETRKINEEEEDLLKKMQKLRELVEMIHSARKEKGIPVRQPLSKVTVKSADIVAFGEEIIKVAKDEVNIKNIVFEKGANEIELDTKITPELEEEAKARDLVRKIQEERKTLGLSLKSKTMVTSPWLPENKSLIDWVKTKTLSQKLQLGDSFKVSPL